jgi:hypothetical protein
MSRVNALRTANGLAPHLIMSGAYEPQESGD